MVESSQTTIHGYRRRTVYLLLIIMLVFGLIFGLSIVALHNGKTVFGLGFPYENYIVMLLCLASIVRAIAEMTSVETKESHTKAIRHDAL